MNFKKRSRSGKEADLPNSSSGAVSQKSRISYRCKMVAASCVLIASLFAPSPAFALPFSISGDFRGTTGLFCVVCTLETELDGVMWGSDTITFAVPERPVSVGGLAFVDIQPFDKFVITTVYGIDLNPSDPSLKLTGFNPGSPQLLPLSPEIFFSHFGTRYTSFSQDSVQLSNIGSVLPGFNLSSFANGDPLSLLYVYRTQVPASEFVVPEPSLTWLLAGVAPMLACRQRWGLRRRNVHST